MVEGEYVSSGSGLARFKAAYAASLCPPLVVGTSSSGACIRKPPVALVKASGPRYCESSWVRRF